jgi:hypothetical protein
VLRLAGLDGEELRAELHPVDPDAVELLPAPTWVRVLWAKGTAAMALGNRVLIRPDLLGRPAKELGRLVIHELVHARQWSDYGAIGFARRYLARYLSGLARGRRHRLAYRTNPYEAEAREVADRYAPVTR